MILSAVIGTKLQPVTQRMYHHHGGSGRAVSWTGTCRLVRAQIFGAA